MNRVGERFDWTAAAVAMLKDLWRRGFSASKIGYQLGYPCTRAAVLGKLSRLGLLGLAGRMPGTPIQRAPRRRHNGGAAVAIGYEPIQDSYADLQIPVAQRKTLFELTADHCRWPVGQPSEPDFFFCGAPPILGHAYCGPHCARAFNHQPRKLNLSDAERQRRSAQARMNQHTRQYGI